MNLDPDLDLARSTLFVCHSCGIPVELSRADAESFGTWERQLGASIVVHCLSCFGECTS